MGSLELLLLPMLLDDLQHPVTVSIIWFYFGALRFCCKKCPHSDYSLHDQS